ncbi:hypothetical protein J3D47_004851 [Pseudomonas laurylsulfativorans]|uniref:hypothetical protein n=1 Tax=Pseudomonas laurylsulfativorans TaxID=1943631 RepID=UPI0020A16282|nr:hypothetical protein [Pseudomonas laurylsulfativorans]MCP1420608.1 hypothetical protein [Pseudomonas laurylsulfativorans]
MNFISTYGKEIVSLIVPIITWLLNSGLKAKAKLVWTSPHSFTFLVQEPIRDADGNVLSPTQRVCTASIKVINTGRDTANKVELVFNWRPQYINLWPVRHFESKTDQDGRHILIFDNLSPKEEIGIEIMCINADLPALLVVRSAECTALNVQLMWVRLTSQWKINVVRFLLLLGASTFLYWLIALIQFLVLKTPI